MQALGWIASFGAPLPSLFFARAVEFLARRGGGKNSDAFGAARIRCWFDITLVSRTLCSASAVHRRAGSLHKRRACHDPGSAAQHLHAALRPGNMSTARVIVTDDIDEQRSENFTPEDFQMRFDAAAQAAQREYCDIFEFWRACRLKSCRRSKACGGDPQLCLKRGYAQVPHELYDRALARVIAATAADADRPTKLARQMSPQSFYLWPLREKQ